MENGIGGFWNNCSRNLRDGRGFGFWGGKIFGAPRTNFQHIGIKYSWLLDDPHVAVRLSDEKKIVTI